VNLEFIGLSEIRSVGHRDSRVSRESGFAFSLPGREGKRERALASFALVRQYQ